MILKKFYLLDQINLILLKSIGRPVIDNKFEPNKLKLFLKNELA